MFVMQFAGEKKCTVAIFSRWLASKLSVQQETERGNGYAWLNGSTLKHWNQFCLHRRIDFHKLRDWSVFMKDYSSLLDSSDICRRERKWLCWTTCVYRSFSKWSIRQRQANIEQVKLLDVLPMILRSLVRKGTEVKQSISSLERRRCTCLLMTSEREMEYPDDG